MYALMRHFEVFILAQNIQFGRIGHVWGPQTHDTKIFARPKIVFYVKTMRTVKHIKISIFLKHTEVAHFARQAVAAGIERFSSKIEIMGFGPQKSIFKTNICVWRFRNHVEVIYEFYSKFWGYLTFVVEIVDHFPKHPFFAKKSREKRCGTAPPKYVLCLRQPRLRRKTHNFQKIQNVIPHVPT